MSKFAIACIGVLIGLFLIIIFAFGYVNGKAAMCSDFGGIYVDAHCMNKTSLLEPR